MEFHLSSDEKKYEGQQPSFLKPSLAPHSKSMVEVSPRSPSPTSPEQEPLSSLSNPLPLNLLEILLDQLELQLVPV